MSNPDDYTIGWVCALSKEFTAAKTMLDENHPPCSIPNRDTNQYALGKIGRHNVVIAVLPDGEYGLSSASNVATNMLNAFPNIRIGLLVGIGGGAPTSRKDIRLGDVVVSSTGQGTGGIFQYDFGRTVQEMEFQTTGFLNQAPTALRTAISALKTEHEMNGHHIQEAIGEGLQRYPRLKRRYSRPPRSHDRLYLSTSVHPLKDRRTCDDACGEGTEAEPKLVKRDERGEGDDDPTIHYGIIASANQLMRDAKIRDKLSSENGVICFEMEAAGLVNTFPCAVIRGICDYADTHKNDEWQEYAAMTAAAYAKELLSQVSVTRIEEERRMNEVLGQLRSTVDEINSTMEGQREVLDVINNRAESHQYREIIDKLPYVKDAAFDSHSEEHNPKCLENTRVDLLTQISEWVENDDSKTVFWLNGMAGTGKSTISRTVAQILSSKGILGASFFFKRGYADQGSAAKFCTTIARQLALNQMFFGTVLQSAIKKDPEIGNKGLRLQFEKLLMEPLAEAAKHQPPGSLNIAIIVDALDECNSEQDIKLLINLFTQMGKLHDVKLRALLTSRPELPIRLGFNSVTGSFTDLILHQIPRPVIEHDISLFFRHEIRRIVLDWNNSVTESRWLPLDWPGDDNLHILIERAIPLFIFAATMCRFISDRNSGPKTRLKQIIESTSWSSGDQMQATYAPVLDQLLVGLSPRGRTDAIREFQTIVGAIVLLETPLPIDVLSRLIDVDQDRIHDRLDKLHSVLDIPESPAVPIRLFHLSFREYLIDEVNYPCNEFTINYKCISRKLSADCLRVMAASLKTDICDLRHPKTDRVYIKRDRIYSHLSSELQYACVYWVKHLALAGVESADTQPIMDFLKMHLLHWIEALVLLNRPWEINGLLKTLRTVCKNDLPLSEFLEDALKFLNFSITTVATHPLQLYSHALLFAPENSLVKLNFMKDIPEWIDAVPNMSADWDSSLRVFTSASKCIRFIPNTTQLFARLGHPWDFGLLDWDTGKRSTLLFNERSRLSPDCKVIALSSYLFHNVVEIREFKTDVIWCELQVDWKSDSELFFSPNSKLLLVSTTKGWQIWDWAAGTELCRFAWNHDPGKAFSRPKFRARKFNMAIRDGDITTSATFSPDGKVVVTTPGYTNRLKVWDWEREFHRSKREHASTISVSKIFGVSLSPDSKKLAVKHHHMAEIYDISLGKLARLSTVGQESENLDYFSPDSKFYVSQRFYGSDCRMTHILLSDTCTGVPAWHLHERDRHLNMTFSDDSQWMAVTSTPEKEGWRHLQITAHSRKIRLLQTVQNKTFFRWQTCSYCGYRHI
ncbi:uncharacterized protein FIESC28_11176 [Fusarium coffeatum]|uniref:Nephrocystin 3-like N-terminal domain-containing protein n=1 Tax=Fusarium coffeatum TaxID=231269 RepID=A0A366QMK7_9HYPO|nr:uncharacterized protein FIESC28_11176 [Fusarium coffeatum]RBR06161.1 hypothetical protein FIESC28_11176 [Fusarium coffeatum]